MDGWEYMEGLGLTAIGGDAQHLAFWTRRLVQVCLGGRHIYIYSSSSSMQTAIKALYIHYQNILPP